MISYFWRRCRNGCYSFLISLCSFSSDESKVLSLATESMQVVLISSTFARQINKCLCCHLGGALHFRCVQLYTASQLANVDHELAVPTSFRVNLAQSERGCYLRLRRKATLEPVVAPERFAVLEVGGDWWRRSPPTIDGGAPPDTLEAPLSSTTWANKNRT